MAGMVRVSLNAVNVARDLWPEAMRQATLILNVLNDETVPQASPFECLYGRKFDASVLHPLGCTAFAFNPTHKKGGIHRSHDPGMHLGYDIASRC